MAKHPGGRPKKDIDFGKVRELSKILCTEDEIAAILGVSVDTLRRRGEDYQRAREEGMAEGRKSLRRAQYENAMLGNPTMQIWLGKQILGQREPKTEIQHSGEIARPMAGLSADEIRQALKEGRL